MGIFNIELKDSREESIYIKHLYENKTKLFDNFYIYFIKIFEENMDRCLEDFKKESKLDINEYAIKMNTILSLKSELISICIRSLITELYENKKNGDLVGKDSFERYDNFDKSFEDDNNVKNILKKYPVLEFLIFNKMNTKLQLLLESLERLDKDASEIGRNFDIDVNTIDNIRFSNGDSHNGGKSVLIYYLNDDKKVVYKPHTLAPENSYNRLLEFINSKEELKLKIVNTRVIDMDEYGWQEYIEFSVCESKEEVTNYYYRIGVLLALFNMLKCSDIHSENIITKGENPIIVDMETLLNNDNPLMVDSLLVDYFMDVSDSVLGTMLLPQNTQKSLFDIDLSGLTGEGGVKSNKIVSYNIVDEGTDNIRLEADFVTTQEHENRVVLKDKKMYAENFCDEIELGYSDCFKLILKYKSELVKKIEDNEIFYGRYRQVLRPTHIYAKFIEAGLHPKYLKSMDSRINLFKYLDNSSKYLNEKDRENILKKINAEVDNLVKNDIPYFTSDFETNSIYANNIHTIDGYYIDNLKNIVLNRLGKFDEKYINKQLFYIRMSLYSSSYKKRFKNYVDTDVKNGHATKIFKNNDDFIECVKDIGEFFINNAIWDKEHKSCTWLNIETADDVLNLGPLNYSLYEGGGVILFLAVLGIETGEEKYTNLAKAALKGIEELWHPQKEEKLPLSAFLGIGSVIYLYYNLSILWNDEILYNKFEVQIEKLFTIISEDNVKLDYVSGISGLIILCLNIFEACNNKVALDIAKELGKKLFYEIKDNKNEELTGFAHGYSGFAVALLSLSKYVEDKGYFEIGMQLINKENEHYEDAKNNWNDLREEELRVEDPVFWCYGAAGIGLSRVMIKEKLAHDEVVIDEDIQKSLDKIKMSGFDKELNHSICHGSIGNIDILLNMSDKLNDKELKDYSIKKGKEVINNIYENGIRDGLDINGNIISFMLGISGVGYTLIRLMNSYYPSVLSLDVIRKENYNEFNI